VVSGSVLVQRKEQRLRAQVYELKNAEHMEAALSRRSVENRSSAHVQKRASVKNVSNLKEDVRLRHADSQYLSDVVSVASHYKTYLRRLKELEGIHIAMVERPKLPSEILSSKLR